MSILGNLFIIMALSFTINSTVIAESTDNSNVVGTLIGSVLGGVIGYQFGGGTGQYVATAAGSLIGGAVGNRVAGGDGFGFSNEGYQPEYAYPSDSYDSSDTSYTSNQVTTQATQFTTQATYIGGDDYLIKQQMSNDAKKRNMIRNGEADPYELPYNVSTTQTSWDNPDN